MPAVSKAQQAAAAIALHGEPKPGSAAEQMKKSMTKKELEKFAKTKKKDLPSHVNEEIREVSFKEFLQLNDIEVEEEQMSETYYGFEKLKKKIEAQGKSPEAAAAIAASIGRKKYGKEKFQQMAAAGKRKKS